MNNIAAEDASQNKSDRPIPVNRESNIGEKKPGFEYWIVLIQYRPGLKFGLGIKCVNRNIFIFKADENSLVSGLFNVADRIIDVDGELVHDNFKCKVLILKALKERKMVSLLIERGATESALKEATDVMNEEYTTSIIAPPDVRSIMRKLEAHNQSKPAFVENLSGNAIPSALTKNNARAERKNCTLEQGHKSVIIQMDNEENRDKLKNSEVFGKLWTLIASLDFVQMLRELGKAADCRIAFKKLGIRHVALEVSPQQPVFSALSDVVFHFLSECIPTQPAPIEILMTLMRSTGSEYDIAN